MTIDLDEIILAKHIIENKNYILKKIVIKEEGKTDSYEKLLNEGIILFNQLQF
jgi:hypothetical protein